MDELPDFFLSSAGESELLSEPRACWSRARLRDQVRDDYMLIQIEPPLIGQQFGLGDKDISQLIISARLQGDTLFPVSHWPFPVYVARVLNEKVVRTLSFVAGEVELIGWALIFRTHQEAANHVETMAS
jgi:hypothetical protein